MCPVPYKTITLGSATVPSISALQPVVQYLELNFIKILNKSVSKVTEIHTESRNLNSSSLPFHSSVNLVKLFHLSTPLIPLLLKDSCDK